MLLEQMCCAVLDPPRLRLLICLKQGSLVNLIVYLHAFPYRVPSFPVRQPDRNQLVVGMAIQIYIWIAEIYGDITSISSV